jgi:NAD(P)-dependent dehydrogenase (short-subunit alcohol dehydrogenase family)
METLGQGIRVNTVCPAETDTVMCRAANPPDADKSTWMKPEDIADVILFLASDQSRAMTGATLIAAGCSKLSRWG